MHGKNSSALSMLEKIPRNVTADSDIVTTDSEKIEKSVTINRNERSRCVGIRTRNATEAKEQVMKYGWFEESEIVTDVLETSDAPDVVSR
uniref:Uncharacterized protein n=2 Tax=Candidatus Kentrum sp. SD TaxID=2126332 RepID=A0A450YYD0_9GAMM|nr:MAG: hypothetical protein BECKSD772F_GA0070984_10721 [Candidatus Kentron sp. SD]VFK46469.1 MAG: hypothetical protein BECKSD772E_GA0070983_10741 [Candidatus Kentron sp. SD]